MFYYMHDTANTSFFIFSFSILAVTFFSILAVTFLKYSSVRSQSTLIKCKKKGFSQKKGEKKKFFFLPALENGTEPDTGHGVHLNTSFALPFPVQSDERHILTKKVLQKD